MQNINFNDGYKEFSINNDESRVIRFNPSDYAILERFSQARKEIQEELTKIGDDIEINSNGEPSDDLDQTAEIVKKANSVIREKVNYIFGADVCTPAFGMQSPLSSVKGKSLVERFLDAVAPLIEKEIEAERKASEKRMSKYLGK